MKNLLSYLFFFTLLFTFFNCTDTAVDTVSAATCNKDEIKAPKLISTAEAYDLVANPKYIFVEVSKAAAYEAGHINGAIQTWRPDFRTKTASNVKGMRCSAKELEIFLQNLGVKNETTLIIYDANGSCDAMRLAWVFDYHGYENYKVLNGGKVAWELAEYPLVASPASIVASTDYRFTPKTDSSLLATKAEVLEAIKEEQTILIDTREEYEYLGHCFLHNNTVLPFKKGAYKRGCIPTAIHLNWSDLTDLAHDHRIKCIKDLKHNLSHKGITKDKNIIVYCQSGSRSSHTAFVLREVLGFPNVKNYDGSWIEWSYYAQQDKGVPIEVHTSEEEFDKEFKRLEPLIAN